jgi:hypothetical protein
MTDQTKLEIAQYRGARAQRLMEDELLADSFKGLEEAYTAAWRSTTIDDVAGREKLFLAINIVGKVRDHLGKIVADGNLAAAELRRLAETAERQKTWPEANQPGR